MKTYVYISILYPCVHIITYRECVFGEATNRMFSMKVDFFVESSHDTAPQILLNSRAKQSRYPEPPTTVPGIPCAKRTESSMDWTKKLGKHHPCAFIVTMRYMRSLLRKAKSPMKKHLLFESDDIIAYISLSYAMSQFRAKRSQGMLRFKRTRAEIQAQIQSVPRTIASAGRTIGLVQQVQGPILTGGQFSNRESNMLLMVQKSG